MLGKYLPQALLSFGNEDDVLLQIEVAEEKVLKQINTLKKNKSLGPDGTYPLFWSYLRMMWLNC